MQLTLIVERCQIAEPGALIPRVAHLLSTWGAEVKLFIPEACCFNLAHIQPTADLYLLISRTPLALNLAGMLHSLGAALLNPYPVMNALHNKLIGLRTLQAHGVPVPETYVVTNLAQIKELLTAGPLLIQPQSCSSADAELSGECLISTAYDLATAITPHSPVIAQRSCAPLGRQWQIACIGGEFLGLELQQAGLPGFGKSLALAPVAQSWNKAFSSNNPTSTLDAAGPGSAELTELALRCGRAFDIDLFGVKVVEHQGFLYVVDIVNFPAYHKLPEAAPRLAEYLYAQAQLRQAKKQPPMTRPATSRHLPKTVDPPRMFSSPVYTTKSPSSRFMQPLMGYKHLASAL